MDFEHAIRVHSDWKIKLHQFLNDTTSHILDEVEIGKDDKCDLGKFLCCSSDAKKYETLPEMKELRKLHSDFHKEVAHIITRKKRGEDVNSDIALGSHSKFGEYSQKLVLLLMSLKKKYKS